MRDMSMGNDLVCKETARPTVHSILRTLARRECQGLTNGVPDMRVALIARRPPIKRIVWRVWPPTLTSQKVRAVSQRRTQGTV